MQSAAFKASCSAATLLQELSAPHSGSRDAATYWSCGQASPAVPAQRRQASLMGGISRRAARVTRAWGATAVPCYLCTLLGLPPNRPRLRCSKSHCVS